MAKFRPMPSQDYIRDWLDYDSATGEFRWRKEPRIVACHKGKVAGTRRPVGYVLIGVPKYGQLFAHRLAWIYVHGEIPQDSEIDHINRDPSDNRISNLRLSTSSQQKMNKSVQSNNRSGLKGAYYHSCRKGKKWRSQLRYGKKYVFLGYFATAQEAHEAYCKAAKAHFGEYSTSGGV